MQRQDVAEWLLDHGGPAIRYRTAAELLTLPHSDELGRLEADLISASSVQTWLERLRPDFALHSLHGSKPACFENVMGKLAQMGCRAGMEPMDSSAAPYLRWLEATHDEGFEQQAYKKPIVAAFLMRAGYAHVPSVVEVAQRRLELVYDFCRLGRYDIFVEPAGYPAIPSAYRRHGLVDPALYENGQMRLPDLYDLHLLGSLPQHLLDDAAARKLDTIVEYVLQPEYQHLPPGYGIALYDKRRYWAIGWSVHLPGYFGLDAAAPEMRRLVRMAVLMGQFAAARRHTWFHNAVAHLDSYRTGSGTHRFPANYLQEGNSGYWVLGAYMGLEPNRRRRNAFELESTFWMQKLTAQ